MDMLVLAPMLWAGYCQSIQSSWHRSDDISGPCLSLESSPSGFGIHGKLGAEFAGVGIQYGHPIELTKDLSLVLKIGGGSLYSNTFYNGVRQVTLFEFTSSLEVHYSWYGVRVGYTHSSNGKGMVSNNVGQDLAELSIGLRF